MMFLTLIYLGFIYGVIHLGGGAFLPPLFKIRNNGHKSIKIGRKAENHVKIHKITLNFIKQKFMLTSALFVPNFSIFSVKLQFGKNLIAFEPLIAEKCLTTQMKALLMYIVKIYI